MSKSPKNGRPLGRVAREKRWPALPLPEWESTYRTLHMWTQIVGKIRLELSPLENHFWNVALYLDPRGLTTSAIPYRGEAFEMRFDFIDHRLVVSTSFGAAVAIALAAKSVATFYRELMSELAALGIQVRINTKPQE
ncbi:MAG TPA: DUF5996 family protein, partial [Thermoanaerobaculia bacterium]|nr:DUF5996 family protein [Thermoanaerobaculia bacterium]